MPDTLATPQAPVPFARAHVDRRAAPLPRPTFAGRVDAAVAAAGLDALIVLSVDAYRWISGFWAPYARYYLDRPQLVIWRRTGEPVLLAGDEALPGPAADSWITDLRGYNEDGRSAETAIALALSDTLAELGLTEARIGVESAFFPIAFERRIAEVLPGVTLTAADDLLRAARAVKDDEQIDALRRAARAGEAGLRHAIGAATSEMSEVELGREIGAAIVARGADDLTVLQLGVGERSRSFFKPLERPLSVGGFLRVDLNAQRDGWYADMGRMAFVGEPTDAELAVYAHEVALNEALIEFIRPGVRADEVFAEFVRLVEAMGVTALDQPSLGVGHGIGTNPNEYPKLNRGDTTVLEPGMVLNIEPDIIGPQLELVHVENTLLVVDDGCELLTPMDTWRELPVIA